MAKGRGMDTEVLPEDKKRKLSKESVKKTLKIFRFILPYRTTFLVGILFLVLSLTTNILFPKLIGEIVGVIEGKSSYTIDQVVLVLIGILILQSLFSFGRIYFFSIVSEKSMADIRRTVYSKIISLPVSFFEQRRVGELMSR
ncbi:ABC transporter transmembrane domain-containing protein, partial [Runella sp.]